MAMHWKSEKWKIADLKEYDKNPRSLDRHQSKNLKDSLSKFGLCEPIVINTDGLIIGGHQRVRTLIKLKRRWVDVYIPEKQLTEKEVEELNIRLNKNQGSWDFDLLANHWHPSELVDWGFDEKELGLDFKEEIIEEKPKKEKESPWTPVNKKLPKIQKPLLVVIKGSGIRTVSLARYKNKSWDIEEIREVTVTHWMPFPEPPLDDD